jgi:hypothetical protein
VFQNTARFPVAQALEPQANKKGRKIRWANWKAK